ncbi:MAG: hypothetical protein LLF87_08110 [Eubacteriales bacterium]|nr:hypothetical protein [Eubacteriales bacterium]
MRRDANRPYVLNGELYTGPQDKLKYSVVINNEKARPYPNPVYTAKSTVPPERGANAAQLPGRPSRETMVDASHLTDYHNKRQTTTEFADGSFDHYNYLMQQALEANGAAGEFTNRLTEEGVPRPKTQWAADVAKGMVPITSFTNPLQTQITNIGVRPIPPGSTIYLDLNDEDKKLGKQTLRMSVGIGAGWAGAAAGAELGAMGGAAIGTLTCPGLGTVIGGFIGGIGGGIAGALSARALGEYIVDETYKGR